MQIAIDAAGFTPAEADELRQAMGAKRSGARMARLRDRLFAGMAERGITGEVAEEIVGKLAAFANFGFPESHAVSFAYLVYSSAWLKLHYPAAFCAGAAQRPAHGVLVAAVAWWPTPAATAWSSAGPTSTPAGPTRDSRRTGPGVACGQRPALRLGLASVRGHRGGDGASGSPRAGPTRRWRTWCAGPG